MPLASSEVERRGHEPRDGGSLRQLEKQDTALRIRVRPLAFLHFFKITESIMSFVSYDFFLQIRKPRVRGTHTVAKVAPCWVWGWELVQTGGKLVLTGTGDKS